MQPSMWTNIGLIFRREVRDQLRDRRTLFMIAILPLLLYPLMAMAFLQVTQFLKRHPSKVLVVSQSPLPTDPPLVIDGSVPWLNASEAELLEIEYMETEFPSPAKAAAQASAMIDDRTFDAVVCFPPRFTEYVDEVQRQALEMKSAQTGSDEESIFDLCEGATAGTSPAAPNSGEPDLGYAANEPLIYYNAAIDNSQIAFERVSFVLEQYRRKLTIDTRKPVEAAPVVASPFELSVKDTSRPVVRRAHMWAKILPFVVLVWALTGAFYPAVDTCAGEKERGTLETLLSSPAQRIEIVIGKLFTIMLFSITTAVLNLACIAFTSSFLVTQLSDVLGNAASAVGPPPASTFLWLLVILIPISALFSALSLALATMAKSTKEGQYYLMPLLMGFMPLMILPTLPSVQMDLGTAIIPVTGVVLLLRLLIEGQWSQAMLYAVPVLFTTLVCCSLAIRWAVDQFNNENVLFRESERFSIRLWLHRLFREPAPTPTFGAAILCGVLILLIRFFSSLTATMPASWGGFVIVTLITLVCLVAGPAVLLANSITSEPRKTLLLLRPERWHAVPAAMMLAFFLHPLAMALMTVIRRLYPIDTAALEPLTQIFASAPNMWCLVALFAIAPAICEELAFRGFILSGLRHTGNKWRAILISSLFFGVTHGVLQQSIVASIFGMILGYIAIQSGSIFPCMAFHAVHNAMGLVATEYVPWIVEQYPDLGWAFEQITDSAAGEPSLYSYGPAIIFLSCLMSAFILRWFSTLQHQRSDEEKLCEALKNQPIQVAG